MVWISKLFHLCKFLLCIIPTSLIWLFDCLYNHSKTAMSCVAGLMKFQFASGEAHRRIS